MFNNQKERERGPKSYRANGLKDKRNKENLDKPFKRRPFSENLVQSKNLRTELGVRTYAAQFKTLDQILKRYKIKESQIVDYFKLNLKTFFISDKVCHTLSTGKTYVYRTLALVGTSGYIGCGVGKSKIKVKSKVKAIEKAKKDMLSLQVLKKSTLNHDNTLVSSYAPITTSWGKKGSTKIIVEAIPGKSLTASQLGKQYCNLCNLDGIIIKTANKKRSARGKVGSKLNYYTALHEALRMQISRAKKSIQ